MPVQTKWGKSLARAREMSSQELRTRLRQEVSKRTDAVIFALGAGRIVLRRQLSPGGQRQRASEKTPHQLPPSPGRFFFEADDLPGLTHALQRALPHQAERILEQAERICRHRFDLLGYENLDYGDAIDWRLDAVSGKRAPRKAWYKIHYLDFNEVGDHKVTWELNRHQHLVTLAKAWHLSRDPRFVAELVSQWRHWHRENPYPRGINWASSLEVAFRSFSWIWVGHLLAGCPVAPESFQRELARSLALSARYIERYLSSYSSPNTHLLGEAAGLFFIGTLCQSLRFAARWQALGWRILQEEAERQVQADGTHFEQSTYYHVYALDFFLHARTLAALNDIPIPANFDRTIKKMLDVLCGSSQAGLATGFGDDDGGRVFDPRRNRREHLRDPLSIGAALFRDPALKAASGGLTEETLWLLGLAGAERFGALPDAAHSPVSTCFPDAGLYVMTGAAFDTCDRLGRRGGEAIFQPQVAIDAGPQGAGNSGHGHADALSMQLSVAGEEWLIDPGACRYITAGGERNLFRGTTAHNTLQVDGMSQADPVTPFAWRNLPHVSCEQWITGKSFDLFEGSHDGYMRLPEPVLHRRWIFNLKSRFWLVRDLAEGEGEHALEILWHFAPYFAPSYTPPGFTLRSHTAPSGQPRGLVVIPAERHGWSPEFRRGRMSPVYGMEMLSPVLSFSRVGRLPAELTMILAPVEQATGAAGKLSSVGDAEQGRARGWRYEAPRGQHLFLFGDAGRPWQLGRWASDASFVYAGIESGAPLRLALCRGGYFEIDGRRAITCSGRVERCELAAARQTGELSCSQPDATVDYRLELLKTVMSGG
ncbi:MAG: alginate lyase family protein [Terriglobia bacterium]